VGGGLGAVAMDVDGDAAADHASAKIADLLALDGDGGGGGVVGRGVDAADALLPPGAFEIGEAGLGLGDAVRGGGFQAAAGVDVQAALGLDPQLVIGVEGLGEGAAGPVASKDGGDDPVCQVAGGAVDAAERVVGVGGLDPPGVGLAFPLWWCVPDCRSGSGSRNLRVRCGWPGGRSCLGCRRPHSRYGWRSGPGRRGFWPSFQEKAL
jgi:hypothetical protein